MMTSTPPNCRIIQPTSAVGCYHRDGNSTILKVATVRRRSSEGADRGAGNQSTVRRNTQRISGASAICRCLRAAVLRIRGFHHRGVGGRCGGNGVGAFRRAPKSDGSKREHCAGQRVANRAFRRPGAITDMISTRRRVKPATPPAWIKPQLAALVDKAPDGPDWLHEIKFDGSDARPTGRRESTNPDSPG